VFNPFSHPAEEGKKIEKKWIELDDVSVGRVVRRLSGWGWPTVDHGEDWGSR